MGHKTLRAVLMAVISAVLFTDLQAAAPGPTADDAGSTDLFRRGYRN